MALLWRTDYWPFVGKGGFSGEEAWMIPVGFSGPQAADSICRPCQPTSVTLTTNMTYTWVTVKATSEAQAHLTQNP